MRANFTAQPESSKDFTIATYLKSLNLISVILFYSSRLIMPADFELRSENHIIDSWQFQRLLRRSRAWLEENEHYREPYDILIAIGEQGRSPYEQELIQDFDDQENQELGDQEYDGSGRPINLRSERIARDQVRAANEVLETAGIIEEYSTVKKREAKTRRLKEEESRAGLRLLDYGRYSLQMGTWGIVGLRRRIMVRLNFR